MFSLSSSTRTKEEMLVIEVMVELGEVWAIGGL